MSYRINNNTIDIYKYDESILSKIPSNVKKMFIYDCAFDSNLDTLPLNIESLWLELDLTKLYEHDIHFLPPNLKEFGIMCEFNRPIDNLPVNLEKLFIHSNIFNQNLDNLPKKIKDLGILSCNLNCDIDLDNFPNLEKLFINCNLVKNIKNYKGKVKIMTDADDMVDDEYQYLLNSR